MILDIVYKNEKEISLPDLEALFQSVGWLSADYPNRLGRAIRQSATVITAWDSGRLVGLINALDDGELTAYIHYLLVHPDYQQQGIGTQLLNRMKSFYETYLYIIIIAENKPLVPFYLRAGFSAQEEAITMAIISKSTEQKLNS